MSTDYAKLAAARAVMGTGKWHQIPFTDELSVAVRDGLKTVTRRPIKFKTQGLYPARVRSGVNIFVAEKDHESGKYQEYVKCPYGYTGHGLWVREAAKLRAMGGGGRETPHTWFDIAYRADGQVREFLYADVAGSKIPYKKADRWVPPMFMPKWATRTLLRVVDVRAERLWEISEADAKAEGLEAGIWNDRRAAFFNKWEAIYGKVSMAMNPWVWRIQFNLIQAF